MPKATDTSRPFKGKDLTGQKFGRWTVLGFVGKCKGGYLWRCMCECATGGIIFGGHLKQGRSKSCGCLSMEMTGDRRRTHGMSETRTFNIWLGMLQRCNNPLCDRFADYGGRGIKVCERWKQFENFCEDMGESPLGLSIHRIDNDLGYFKANCKWATPKEQARKKRNNRIETINGVSLTLSEHAERVGVNYKLFHQRLSKGWGFDRALSLAKYERHQPVSI